MTKRISLSREAAKTLARIDRATARRIYAKIEQLASAPESLGNNIRQLRGGDGRMRLRMGDWRVIYRDGLVISVIRIAPRGSAYD